MEYLSSWKASCMTSSRYSAARNAISSFLLVGIIKNINWMFIFGDINKTRSKKYCIDHILNIFSTNNISYIIYNNKLIHKKSKFVISDDIYNTVCACIRTSNFIHLDTHNNVMLLDNMVNNKQFILKPQDTIICNMPLKDKISMIATSIS